MKFFFHINVFFLVLFITSNTYAQNQIVADLSQENVKISTDFQGAEILLFGAYDGKKGDDIIVIVTGPKGLVTVQKKEKVLGVGVNTRKVNYINAPKYLSISSNRKIEDKINLKYSPLKMFVNLEPIWTPTTEPNNNIVARTISTVWF